MSIQAFRRVRPNTECGG